MVLYVREAAPLVELEGGLVVPRLKVYRVDSHRGKLPLHGLKERAPDAPSLHVGADAELIHVIFGARVPVRHLAYGKGEHFRSLPGRTHLLKEAEAQRVRVPRKVRHVGIQLVRIVVIPWFFREHIIEEIGHKLAVIPEGQPSQNHGMSSGIALFYTFCPPLSTRGLAPAG